MLPEREKPPLSPDGQEGLVKEYLVVPEVPPGVEAKESAGADLQLAKPVVDTQTGQSLLSSVEPQQVRVTLPLTSYQLSQVLNQKLDTAARWLGEQMKRLLRIKNDKFIYQFKNTGA